MPPRDNRSPEPSSALTRLLEDAHRREPSLDLRPGSSARALLEIVAEGSERAQHALMRALATDNPGHLSPSSAWGSSYGTSPHTTVAQRVAEAEALRADHEHFTRQVYAGLGLLPYSSAENPAEQLEQLHHLYSTGVISREWIEQNLGLSDAGRTLAVDVEGVTPSIHPPVFRPSPLRGFIENRPSNPPSAPQGGLQPQRFLMSQQEWDDIVAWQREEAGTPQTVSAQQARAREEMQAFEDRQIFDALDAYAATQQPGTFAAEYMGVPTPPPIPAPGTDGHRRLVAQTPTGRFWADPMPLHSNPTIRLDEIRNRRFDLINRSHPRESTNPCGEIDLGVTGMTLEQMEKIAQVIRTTSWTRLLKDEYPY